VVVDGVAAPWLQHTAYGRADSGSVTMFGSEVLEHAALEAGAYPQRHGDWVGGQIAITLREGSRVDTELHGTLTGSSATLVGEGPIGSSARGAWLVAARQSFRDWPRKPSNPTASVFGFADAQAKLVYDASGCVLTCLMFVEELMPDRVDALIDQRAPASSARQPAETTVAMLDPLASSLGGAPSMPSMPERPVSAVTWNRWRSEAP
jgi:hypothetical protein